MLSACTSRQTAASDATMGDEEEERIFMLVAEPGATGEFDRAVAVSDSLLANVALSDSLRAYIMLERLTALNNGGRYDECLAFTDTVIRYGSEKGVEEVVCQALQARGIWYRRNHMTDSAVNCYSRALDIVVRNNDVENEQVTADLIAVACAEAGRWDESHKFSNRSLELARRLDDTMAIVGATGTLASTMWKQKRPDDVIRTAKPCLDHMTAPAHYRVKLLVPLIYAYMDLDSIKQAERYLDEAEELLSVYPESHIQNIIAKTARAELYGRQGRYADQYRLLCRLDSLGPTGRERSTDLVARAKCLEHLGRTREALAVLTQAYEALDSMRHDATQSELSDLSVRYDTLTKEMELERAKARHSALINTILVCALLMLLLLAGLIITRQRYRRRLERERREQYISGLEQERARLARELHDDIAGQLVWLQWELPELNREEATERVRGIGERVRSLSHELMPPEFARQSLCQLLLDFTATFNGRHSSPHITLTDEGTFDWDSLNPQQSMELYRIVQESVNNAVKHAEPTYIRIRLDGSRRFSLTVENDGVKSGTTENTESTDRGIGAKTLRTRAGLLGAEVTTTVADGVYRLMIKQK